MYRGQKSVRGGIEDFLCPFENFYLTCGPNESSAHMGTMAIDVRGSERGAREDYFVPATSRCVWTYPSNGQAMWQTVAPVRCPNGYVGIVTYLTCHDDTFNAYVGLELPQGGQLGTMGTKSANGDVTGVHCHIECSQSDDTSWRKNGYGNYCFSTETDPEDVFFMDNTNIINGIGNWRTTADVPVSDNKFINIPPSIEERNVYKIDTKEQFATLKPAKFGGLTYKIYSRDGEYAEIETRDFGNCYVKVTDMTPITDTPQYEHGNY